MRRIKVPANKLRSTDAFLIFMMDHVQATFLNNGRTSV